MNASIRHFVTRSGVRPPFNLTGERQEHGFDSGGRITGFGKLACGDIDGETDVPGFGTEGSAT